MELWIHIKYYSENEFETIFYSFIFISVHMIICGRIIYRIIWMNGCEHEIRSASEHLKWQQAAHFFSSVATKMYVHKYGYMN